MADTPSVEVSAARLRQLSWPIIGRIQADQLLFDPRTVLPGQASALLAGLSRVLAPT
ncbi:MAG: hypothetical protein H6651_05060 [Ardenticatenales bacterium]|nr:hypothetical protein [Ardenticatenales bacterium]